MVPPVRGRRPPLQRPPGRRGAREHAPKVRTREVDAGGGAITVSIRDTSGDPFEALRVGERTFVIGRAGERYSIVLENRTSHRFEAVGTVDGSDVINGKPGSLDHRGYVLMPFATLEIDGFRQSSSSVAAFRFGAIGDSYAAQTGNARNVGVIGVAFFTGAGDSVINERDLRLRDSANPFPSFGPALRAAAEALSRPHSIPKARPLPRRLAFARSR